MENNGNTSVSLKRPSEKSFGIVFSVVFGLFALWAFIRETNFHIYLLISTLFLILAYIKPHSLKVFNIMWFKFGIFLGGFVAPLVMMLVYCFTLVPLSIWLRIRKKDILRIKVSPNENSYWVPRTNKVGSMKNLF